MPAFKACAVNLRRIDDPYQPKETPMLTQNRFLQGVFLFEGAGLDKPAPLADELTTSSPTGWSPRRCTSAAGTPPMSSSRSC